MEASGLLRKEVAAERHLHQIAVKQTWVLATQMLVQEKRVWPWAQWELRNPQIAAPSVDWAI